jgi:hypothetical protein
MASACTLATACSTWAILSSSMADTKESSDSGVSGVGEGVSAREGTESESVGTETLDENLTMVLYTGRELGPQGRSFPAVRATATDRDRANRTWIGIGLAGDPKSIYYKSFNT